jgi:hypothetical protein
MPVWQVSFKRHRFAPKAMLAVSFEPLSRCALWLTIHALGRALW